MTSLNLSIFKLKNKVLPQLDNTVLITENQIIQTDLETTIIYNTRTTAEPGVYSLDLLKLNKSHKVFEVKDYPTINNLDACEHICDINSNVLKRAAMFCGKDDMRPQFDYVVITDNIYATNAHTICSIPYACGDIKIHKNLITLLPLNTQCHLYNSKEYYGIKFGYYNLIGKNLEHMFPNYDAVIIKDQKNVINFKTSDLELKVHAAILKQVTSKQLTFINKRENGTEVKSRDLDLNIEHSTLLPLINIPFDFAVNIDALKTCIGKDQYFILGVTEPQKIITINNYYHLMPLSITK